MSPLSRDVFVRAGLAAIAIGLLVIASTFEEQQILVNTASDGTRSNGSRFSSPALDDSGRYVVFADSGTNLVTGDTNGSLDVFVKDRTSNATTRVSVASDGTERTGDSGSGPGSIDVSGDGRIVVFTSKAALDAGDTNTCGNPVGPCQDIYVHDRGTGQTTRVSVASDGAQANGPSDSPAISRNGRYVAFTSHATNLVTGDTNAASDVFVHDRAAGMTTRVSVSTAGMQGGAGQHSLESRISEDGAIVAFRSSAPLTDTPDPFDCAWTLCHRAFVHDRTAGTTVRVPLEWETLFPDRPPLAATRLNAEVEHLQLDASGRWVALIAAMAYDAVSLVYDRVTGRTLAVDRVSRRYGGGPSSSSIALSGDGVIVESYLGYDSRADPQMVRLNRATRFTLSNASWFESDDLSFTGDVAVYMGSGGVYVFDHDADDDRMRDELQ